MDTASIGSVGEDDHVPDVVLSLGKTVDDLDDRVVEPGPSVVGVDLGLDPAPVDP